MTELVTQMERSGFALGRNSDVAGIQERGVVLSVNGLKKVRGNQAGSFELQVPRLVFGKGRFIGIAGESGCGKSTLLDILALVLRPSGCEQFQLVLGSGVTVDIKALWEARRDADLAIVRRRHLGYVLQSGGLLPFLTVQQNAELPVRIKGLRGAEGDTLRIATRLGLGALLGTKPQFLSGGQRQRAAILRALAHRPSIVLADEPTAAVDKDRARKIVGDLSSLAKESGVTVVMVTHDHDLIAGVAEVTYGFEVVQVSDTLTRSICSEGS
jgi:putative ABC transport system ATP-binding protein